MCSQHLTTCKEICTCPINGILSNSNCIILIAIFVKSGNRQLNRVFRASISRLQFKITEKCKVRRPFYNISQRNLYQNLVYNANGSLRIHFPDSKYLCGFVSDEIFGIFFRHSEISGLYPSTIHARNGLATPRSPLLLENAPPPSNFMMLSTGKNVFLYGI